jgi:hypothetical protein
MELSGQLLATTALPLGKGLQWRIDYKAGWCAGLSWALWRKKSIVPPGNRFRISCPLPGYDTE